MTDKREIDYIFKLIDVQQDYSCITQLEQLNMVSFCPPLEFVELSDFRTIVATTKIPGLYIEPDLFFQIFLEKLPLFWDQFDEIPLRQQEKVRLIFNRVQQGLFENMMSGNSLKKMYSDLNPNQQFELASGLETENLFYIHGKKVSQAIPLSNFETITILTEEVNT